MAQRSEELRRSIRRRATRLSLENLSQLIDNARWALNAARRTHASIVVGLALTTVAGGLLPAASALVMREFINRAVDAAATPEAGIGALAPWLLLGLALGIAETLVLAGTVLLTQFLAGDVDLEVNTMILQHAAQLDVALFEAPRFRDTLDLAQRNTADRFTKFLTTALSLGTRVVQTVSLVLVLAAVQPFALLLWAPIGLAQSVFQWRLSRTMYREEFSRATKRRWSRYFASLLMSHHSVPEVRLLNLASVLTGRFRTIMEEFRQRDRRIHTIAFIGNSVLSILSTAALFAVLAMVYQQFVQGRLLVGDIVLFGTAGMRLGSVLERVVRDITRAMEHALYVSNLRQFLDVQPRMASSPSRTPSETRGEIAFQNVTFTYPGASAPALTDISFRIAPGEIVALVGKNGAGKSTLVKLVARFYDPDSGCVQLDGIDLRQLSLTYLHRQIGMVFQHVNRYEATVSENIQYGDWERLLGDPDLTAQVARDAGIEALIDSLPQGYDTLLGRQFGEFDLSAGQWQQLAISRAWARDPGVLILDEPAANLDALAEFMLFSRMRELAKGKTTILISQRFSTVRMADRIMVIEEGRLVESGTHEELVGQGGLYATLYGLQQSQLTVGGTQRQA
jgi:ATP-binding cassette subfamily B protein